MKTLKLPKSIQVVALSALVALGADTEASLAKTLQPTNTLSKKEIILDGKLDKFIDSGYQCVLSTSDFGAEGNVVDAQGLLTDSEENLLENMIEQIKEKNGIKVMLVTKGEQGRQGSMSEFGTNFGHCLGVGLDKVDNGIVIQLDTVDRETFISTGYGTEFAITDAEAGRISRSSNDYFRKGDIAGGLANLVEGVEKAINESEESEIKGEIANLNEDDLKESYSLALLIAGLGIMVTIGGGAYGLTRIREAKRKYDELVTKFNNNAVAISNQREVVDTLFSTFEEKLNGTKDSIDFEKYAWADQLFQSFGPKASFVKEGLKGLDENQSMKNAYKYSLCAAEGSWLDFARGGTESMEKSLKSDDDVLELLKVLNEVIQTLEEILYNAYKSFEKLSQMGNLIKKFKSKLEDRKIYISKLEGEGYVFDKSKSQIEGSVDSIASLVVKLEGLFNEMNKGKIGPEVVVGLFEDITDLLEDLDKLDLALEKKVKLYEVGLSKFDEKKIPDEAIKKCDTCVNQLENMLPEVLMENIKSQSSKVGMNLVHQTEIFEEAKIAYENKDLDNFMYHYSRYLEHLSQALESVKDVLQYQEKQEQAKRKTKKLISSSSHILKDTKKLLHSNYKRDYERNKSIYSALIEESKLEKTDWISLAISLAESIKLFQDIIKNSGQRFAAEKREAERKAREKREAERIASISTTSRSGGGSNNFGGGGFGGGGGGSKW